MAHDEHGCLWEPARGAEAPPVELASAVIVPAGTGSGQVVTVDTPAGRVRLDCRAGTFAMLQHLATDPDGSTEDREVAPRNEAPGQSVCTARFSR